jgi:hypothetical protein
LRLSRPEFQSSSHQSPAALGVSPEMADLAGAGGGAAVAARNQNGAAIGRARFEAWFSWSASLFEGRALQWG